LKKKTSKQKGKTFKRKSLYNFSAATPVIKKPDEKPKEEIKKKSSRLSDSSDDSSGNFSLL